MTCTNCGGPMIEGFTSRYCKNECDLKAKAAENALDVKLPLTPPEWTKIRTTDDEIREARGLPSLVVPVSYKGIGVCTLYDPGTRRAWVRLNNGQEPFNPTTVLMDTARPCTVGEDVVLSRDGGAVEPAAPRHAAKSFSFGWSVPCGFGAGKIVEVPPRHGKSQFTNQILGRPVGYDNNETYKITIDVTRAELSLLMDERQRDRLGVAYGASAVIPMAHLTVGERVFDAWREWRAHGPKTSRCRLVRHPDDQVDATVYAPEWLDDEVMVADLDGMAKAVAPNSEIDDEISAAWSNDPSVTKGGGGK